MNCLALQDFKDPFKQWPKFELNFDYGSDEESKEESETANETEVTGSD